MMDDICDPKYNQEDGRVKLLGPQWFLGRTVNSPMKIRPNQQEEEKETDENGPTQDQDQIIS